MRGASRGVLKGGAGSWQSCWPVGNRPVGREGSRPLETMTPCGDCRMVRGKKSLRCWASAARRACRPVCGTTGARVRSRTLYRVRTQHPGCAIRRSVIPSSGFGEWDVKKEAEGERGWGCCENDVNSKGGPSARLRASSTRYGRDSTRHSLPITNAVPTRSSLSIARSAWARRCTDRVARAARVNAPLPSLPRCLTS
jgi:hypothetical protein